MKQLAELVASVVNLPADKLTGESGPGNLDEWDSLAHITIVAAVEQTYGVQLSMPEILAIKSMNDLRGALEKNGVAISDDRVSA